jgi:hypothetical protein
MGTFSVDTDSLDHLSSRLRSSAAEVAALRPASFDSIGLGSPYVIRSVAGFLGAWVSDLELIGDDVSRLADAVASVSRLYADVEWANTRAAS